ncbi:MAG: bifunctional 4-hydroxy-2-oxoglutarate aldolase/2-dehydro-3-deoxy-phosphogluconate aldolase [Gaiellaceae bacterium]
MNGVMTRLAELVLVPVIEIPDPDLAEPLADALLEGGLPCAEITFRTDGAAEAIATIARRYPQLLVGAGTVLSTEQVDQALEAGAQFVVSPGFNPAVVEHALNRGTAVLPGVCTPTEVEMARQQGLDVVKFFPAEPAGGVRYLKALTGPYGFLGFVPTGGIDSEKLEGYLALRQVIAVGGSWMAPFDVLARREFATVVQRTREAVELVRRLRPTTVATPS